MKGYINNYDFGEMEVMKYYAPPATWDATKKKETVRNRIYSGEWLAAEKKDGFFGKFVKGDDGEMLVYSRSRGVDGNYANKIEWMPHLADWFASLPNGTCLLGELYLPKQPGSKCVQTILGCLKDKAIQRQTKGEKINFYVFDCLAWGGVNLMEMGYARRAHYVREIAGREEYQHDYVQYARYYRGDNLWGKLQEILADGGEGMVLVHQDAAYEPGKRPSKTTLKVKQELKQTIDCFFTGNASAPTKEYTGKEIETWQYWEDMVTGEKKEGELFRDYCKGATITPVTKPYFYGWAGSLEIGVLDEANNVVSLGWLSNLTEDVKADAIGQTGKVIEVSAMSYDAVEHTLRHGRMLGWRPDLTMADCTLSKIEG